MTLGAATSLLAQVRQSNLFVADYPCDCNSNSKSQNLAA
jgi:hypothetical protein